MTGQPIGIPNPATSDEVVEGRPWWKVCCTGCCLGILVILGLLFFGIRWFTGPGPKTVDHVPASFPRDFTLFRPEEASQILYYPSTSKSAISRIVTGPLDWVGGLVGNGNEEASSTPSVSQVTNAIASHLHQVEGRDTVALHWKNLNATRDALLRYYAGALKQVGIPSVMGCDVAEDVCVNQGTAIVMKGSGPELSFNLEVNDDPAKAGIDDVSVVVEYPVTAAPSAQ